MRTSILEIILQSTLCIVFFSVNKIREIDRTNLKEIPDDKNYCLGEGVFGQVTKKHYRGIEVAEKSFKTGSVASVNREASIINSFDHPGLFLPRALQCMQIDHTMTMSFE